MTEEEQKNRDRALLDLLYIYERRQYDSEPCKAAAALYRSVGGGDMLTTPDGNQIVTPDSLAVHLAERVQETEMSAVTLSPAALSALYSGQTVGGETVCWDPATPLPNPHRPDLGPKYSMNSIMNLYSPRGDAHTVFLDLRDWDVSNVWFFGMLYRQYRSVERPMVGVDIRGWNTERALVVYRTFGNIHLPALDLRQLNLDKVMYVEAPLNHTRIGSLYADFSLPSLQGVRWLLSNIHADYLDLTTMDQVLKERALSDLQEGSSRVAYMRLGWISEALEQILMGTAFGTYRGIRYTRDDGEYMIDNSGVKVKLC